MKQSLRTALILGTILLFPTTGILAQKGEKVSPEKAVEYLQNGEWGKAVQAFEMITAKQPNNGGAWFQMGYALHAMGEYDKAIEAYSTILDLGSPLAPITMYNLGCTYALKGEATSALEWLDKAADAGFSQIGQVKVDSDLESLHSTKEFKEIIEKIDRNAKPCAYNENAQEFDFWVGSWNVYNKAGQLAGTNSVENILDDCVIAENWSGALGMEGKSYSTYDPSIKKWRQTWVDNKGKTVLFTGEFIEGAMVFEHTTTDTEGVTTLTQMILTPLEDGKVNQKGQSSIDGGETWTTTFDLTYVPQEGKKKGGS